MSSSSRSSATIAAAPPAKPGHFKIVLSHSLVTDEVLNHKYDGAGTEEDPYSVDFIPNDPRDPTLFSTSKKWWITAMLGLAALAVSFNSSAFSGGSKQIIEAFDCSQEQAILGVSLFVLGFAIGPLFWGPLSEMYGRQVWFFITYAAMTAFNAGAAGAQNIETLLVLRFWAGAFGSSPLVNAGGVVSDLFAARERGLAMTFFSIAPFMGPCLGPIIGGFIAVDPNAGFRWLLGVVAIFSGVVWIMGSLLVPETYAPVILRARATELSKRTGKVYVSKLDIGKGKPKILPLLKTTLSRPWVLLLCEPVVAITTVYMAILYGTLFMLFAAFPIVYQEARGWSEGIGGLAFIGVAIGFLLTGVYIIIDNKRFAKLEDEAQARGEPGAPPEARLPPALVGAVLVPIGQFWFAWTNDPSIHWAPSIVAGIPFGMGMTLVFLSVFNYLVDTYTVYAASVLAANSVLRSLFGFAFPLFTTYMYKNLGIHWAASIPAFLALACVPAPFLFYKYGATIRRKQKYSKEAMEIMQKIRGAKQAEKAKQPEPDSSDSESPERPSEPKKELRDDNKDVDLEKGLTN